MKKTFWLGVVLAVAASTAAAWADAPTVSTEPLPFITALPCPNSCNFRRAEPISQKLPSIQRSTNAVYGAFMESMVDIEFVIGTDGAVRDAKALRLFGPQRIANSALDAVRQWTFKPATLNGAPVLERTGIRLYFELRAASFMRNTTSAVFTNATQLMADGNLAEAREALLAAEAEDYLNFRERTMLAYALAKVLIREENHRAAWTWISVALLKDGQYIDPDFRASAYRMAFNIAARNNDLATALQIANGLTRNGQGDAELVRAVAEIRAQITSSEPIVVAGWLPPVGEGAPYWHHPLVRQTFAFNGVRGTLGKVRLRCDEQGIESDVTTTAEWHVPAGWSNCFVTVDGAPGTPFNFVELN